MTYPDMVMDVLAMDKLTDPKQLYEVLSGGVIVNKSEVRKASEEEIKEVEEKFENAVGFNFLSKLDEQLDKLINQ